MRIAALIVILFGACGLQAQWVMQQSNTTAGLRGIHNVGDRIAWASGTNGIVLRTQDGGHVWQTCTVPPGAEKLDFRAVWAWDANEAMVMAAGPGEQSRLYRTTDGCKSWKQELVNEEKDGFWDAMVFQNGKSSYADAANTGILIGDPVWGHFDTLILTAKREWSVEKNACAAREGESAFAASNSSAFVFGSRRYVIGTGGKGGPRVLLSPLLAYGDASKPCLAVSVPLAAGNDSSGVFSLYFRDAKHGVAVGGDYKQPNNSSGTAAWTNDGGRHWTAASKSPHGYRSSMAWDADLKAWIAAGTNGSDVSYDDGKTWKALDNGEWNALSLPYVVGPKGRIAKLDHAEVKR